MSLTPKTTENRTKLKALHLISHNRAHTAKLAHRHRSVWAATWRDCTYYSLVNAKVVGYLNSQQHFGRWASLRRHCASCGMIVRSWVAREEKGRITGNGKRKRNRGKGKRKKKRQAEKGGEYSVKSLNFVLGAYQVIILEESLSIFFLHFYGLFFMHMVVCTHVCICVRVEGRDQHLVSIFLPLSSSSLPWLLPSTITPHFIVSVEDSSLAPHSRVADTSLAEQNSLPTPSLLHPGAPTAWQSAK